MMYVRVVSCWEGEEAITGLLLSWGRVGTTSASNEGNLFLSNEINVVRSLLALGLAGTALALRAGWMGGCLE
jgi:hypothetical protein